MKVEQKLIIGSEKKEIIKPSREIIIGVWAAMGTGKTTLINGMGEILPDSLVVDEDYEGNKYLDLQYKDPKRYSFNCQVWSRIRKAERYLEIDPNKVTLIIPDGVDGSYARTYRELGNISDLDWSTYLRIEKVLNAYLPKCDVNLWLEIGNEQRIKRIHDRDRGAESSVNPNFLSILARIMKERCYADGAPVIEVDAEHQDFRNKEKMAEIVEGIEYQIGKELKSKFNDPVLGIKKPQFLIDGGQWV